MQGVSDSGPDGLIKLGGCLVDTDACTIQRDGESNKVTPRSIDVLLYLTTHGDRIVSSDELLDEFWSPVASDHAVHKAIAELRNALGDNVRAQRFIKTVPKRGYKLLVEPNAPEPRGRWPVLAKLRQALVARWHYSDPQHLVVGLMLLLMLVSLSLFAPLLQRNPDSRSFLILELHPIQLQLADDDRVATTLFAQGLYANLITSLSAVDSLRIVPLNPFDFYAEGSDNLADRPAGPVDYQFHGVLVQSATGASLYINMIRASNGIVEYSQRVQVAPTVEPAELDQLSAILVESIVTHVVRAQTTAAGTGRR